MNSIIYYRITFGYVRFQILHLAPQLDDPNINTRFRNICIPDAWLY